MTAEKIAEIRERLPEGMREKFDADPRAFLAALAHELKTRQDLFPSKGFVPNVAQERALLCYKQRHPTYKDYPLVNVFTGSNALGKTAVAAVLLGGLTLGPAFLHPEYFGSHQLFQEYDALRKKRRARIRIVCHKADMVENGSMHQEISKWIPCAVFSGKQGDYFTKITVPAPSPEYHETIIDIKTFDMEKKAHAGPTLDFIITNEPMPENLYTENIGRLRDDGHIAMFLTPINDAAYLHKVVTGSGPEGEVCHTTGNIWENCADIPGMRGHLSKQKIESLIRQWTASNPLEVDARVYGKFVHLAGSIFPLFSQGVHVIPPVPIDPKWNGYQGIDPHPVKPAATVWMHQGPMNTWYIVGEYPTEPWDEVGRTPLTIEMMVGEMNRIEQGRHYQFPYGQPLSIPDRIGDPNGMKAEFANNRSSMKDEFDKFLLSPLNIKVDNDISLRHDKINELLFYDPARPVGPMNRPRLYVFSWCRNMIRAFQEYRYKTTLGGGMGLSDKIDETWKCLIDIVGYIVTTAGGWEERSVNPGSNQYSAEYAAILAGRGIDSHEQSSSYAPWAQGYGGGRLF